MEKAGERGVKKDFIEVLAETKRFVEWCQDRFVQAEASELIQEAENEFVDHGPGDKTWNAVNAARRLTAESRAKFHKGLAEKAIAEAAEKLASAKASENGFYSRASKSLEEARTFITESEKDRRSQIQLLKDAEEKAKSASRALDLLLAEQEKNKSRNENGYAKGSEKALKEQGQSLKRQGYEYASKKAYDRAKGDHRRYEE